MNEYGVIFDMDGVLVNSYQAHLQSWQQTAASLGLRMSPAEFAKTFGRTSREIIQQLWPNRLNDAQIRVFDERKERAYRESIRQDFPEMPGAGDLIAALHEAGFRIAIGSSGPAENVAVVQQCIPNGQLVSAVAHGGEVSHGKPDPQVFLLAAQKLALKPAQCAVIEDSLVGLQAARRAGMTAIALTGTASRETLLPHADQVVDSLRDPAPQSIAELIRRRQGSRA
ncbi:MAG: HAD family hydrolase [Bacillota bacterium]